MDENELLVSEQLVSVETDITVKELTVTEADGEITTDVSGKVLNVHIIQSGLVPAAGEGGASDAIDVAYDLTSPDNEAIQQAYVGIEQLMSGLLGLTPHMDDVQGMIEAIVGAFVYLSTNLQSNFNVNRDTDTQQAIINWLTANVAKWRAGIYYSGSEDWVLHRSGSGDLIRAYFDTGVLELTNVLIAGGFDAGAHKLLNLLDGTDPSDAATVSQVDSAKDRANHIGTQLAATISDFDAQVRTSRLDQMAAPTAAVGMNSQRLTGLLDPTNPQDAATRAYVLAQIANLVNSSPGALDTLSELAAALGNDPNFATTVSTNIAAKIDKTLADANTVLGAVVDDTPIAISIPSSTFFGRKATGNLVAMTVAEAKALLALVKGDVGLGNADNTSDATKNAAAVKLTNKRNQQRVYSAASTATLTPEKDTYDAFTLTAQAVALNIANHVTTTADDFDKIQIRILDNGSAQAITYGTNYVARGGIALPSTTVAGKLLELGFEWNAAISKYNLIAATQET